MKNINLSIWVIAILNVILHLLCYNNLEYMRDELLYLSFGNHLAAGYASTPPLMGLLSFFLQISIGNSLFAVRLLPALGSGLMVIMTAFIAKDLGGRVYAQILAAFAILVSPFILRTFLLYQPVFLDLLFWTLIFLLLIRFINTNSPKYLVYLGIVAGLAMSNKYLVALLIFVILAVLVFTKYRTIFAQKQLYFGIFAGFLIFLPNLIWQFQNHFPVIHHITELNDTQLIHVNRLAFVFDQLMMPFFVSFLTISGLLYLFLNKKMIKYRFLGIIVVLVLAILCLLRAKSYYSMGVFPILIAAGSVWYEGIAKSIYLKSGLMLVFILLLIPILPLTLPIFKTDGMVRYFKNAEEKYGMKNGRQFEDGTVHSLPQDYADMIGWEELVFITNKAYQKIEEKNKAFIYCENYGQAGAISIIGKKYGLPEPVSFSDAYRSWIPLSFPIDIEYFIYINDELGKDVADLFESIEKIGFITNIHSREYGTTVYLCKHPKMSFNKWWAERLKSLR